MACALERIPLYNPEAARPNRMPARILADQSRVSCAKRKAIMIPKNIETKGAYFACNHPVIFTICVKATMIGTVAAAPSVMDEINSVFHIQNHILIFFVQLIV